MDKYELKNDGMNCSTILIGKRASKTGKVIAAHNEDDMHELIQSHLVPRMKHEKGETVSAPDGAAVVPQVKETWAYYWSEARGRGGEPFADGYVNEWGVSLFSNSCVDSKVPADGKFDGTMGYVYRRLIPERARTAREGVEITAELMKKYGYRSSRCYAICDKDEAWLVQLTKGHNFAARRVGDNEIAYIPNWYTIHEIDFNDKKHKNFYWSDTLVSYAMENGWYTPAVEGDYSDFDFAAVYQAGGYDIKSNWDRSDLAWKLLLKGDPVPHRTFSIKAPRKYSVEDLKPIMRSHYAEHAEDLKDHPDMSPHRYGICRDTTVEYTIVEFNEVPELTCMWRSLPRPCATPFMPWYLGITEIPKGYEWMGPKEALASHFAVDEDEFAYHAGRAVSAFLLLQNVMEFNYQAAEERIHGEIAVMEKEWAATKKVIDQAYLELVGKNKDYACALLTDYTSAQAYKTWNWAKQAVLNIAMDRDNANMHYWRSKL
ncbi:MAG: C69 family dipeptidase [Solobacterium sp.]|nr:C69 family dipeptidase [Solobacterium sp.]